MVRVDIKSLFTNILLDETIQIVTDSLYPDPVASPVITSSFFRHYFLILLENYR